MILATCWGRGNGEKDAGSGKGRKQGGEWEVGGGEGGQEGGGMGIGGWQRGGGDREGESGRG